MRVMHPSGTQKKEPIRATVALVLLVAAWLSGSAFSNSAIPEQISEVRERLRILADNVSDPAKFKSSEDALRLYAVGVVHSTPFRGTFSGVGVYVGNGLVVTAAHVVGRWPAISSLAVLVAGKRLTAKVVKLGSLESTDLAVLSIDQEALPSILNLRRLPVCTSPVSPGQKVAVIEPERITLSKMISPELILPKFKARFPTLIEHQQRSGSGAIAEPQMCLLGIMSRAILKYRLSQVAPPVMQPDGYAGFFEPANKIRAFLSAR